MVWPMVIMAAATMAQQAMQNRANSKNADRQGMIADRNYQEQQRQNREQDKLAKADRRDEFGNITRYTEGRGFEKILSPMTQAILDAQQTEQYKNLTEDASRNRNISRREDTRAQQYDEAFRDDFARSRARRKRSPEEYESEAIIDALLAQGGSDEYLNGLTRLALRQNNSGALQGLLNARKQQNNSSLGAILAAARDAGRAKEQSIEGSRSQRDAQELANLSSGASRTRPTGINFANSEANTSNEINNATELLLRTSAANSQGTQNAISNYRNTSFTPELGGYFQAIAQAANGYAQMQGNAEAKQDAESQRIVDMVRADDAFNREHNTQMALEQLKHQNAIDLLTRRQAFGLKS